MTENRRIFLNVVATYGRSLYGLVLGLLCGRWVLMALGDVDYGLYGLIGGLTAFISFFNSVLANANARFYAFSVGAASVARDKSLALEECRHWFNTALSIHSIVPIALIVMGYPIGAYAIEHWLTIPQDRIQDCIWVFRFVCVSCFVSMVNVPFTAMYTAKQYIAELTIYSFATSTLNVVALYYMVSHPGDWLVRYAVWACILIVVPQTLICIRACYVFPECKVRFSYLWDAARLKQIGAYSGWTILGTLCGMLRSSGMNIVVNKFFGAAMNAAQAIGNTVQAQTMTLAGAVHGAFVPVITQACGAGRNDKMRAFVIRSCKFNVLLSLLFSIPLAIELPTVMRLWLKNPPDYSVGLCYFALAFNLVDCCTVGYSVAIHAKGNIKWYQIVVNAFSIMTIPLAVALGLWKRDVYLVMAAQVVVAAVVSFIRILFARILCGMGAREWVSQVFVPLAFLTVCASAGGVVPRLFLESSFMRLCLTVAVCEAIYLPIAWRFVLSPDERLFVQDKFRAIFNRSR